MSDVDSSAPETPATDEDQKAGRLVRSAIGWAVFLGLLAVVLIVLGKTWFFVDKYRRGEIIDLPQFGTQLSAAGSAPRAKASQPTPATTARTVSPLTSTFCEAATKGCMSKLREVLLDAPLWLTITIKEDFNASAGPRRGQSREAGQV